MPTPEVSIEFFNKIIFFAGIKLPPLIKKRGRPKGRELTVIGLPAKKGRGTSKPKLQPFLRLPTPTKEKGTVKSTPNCPIIAFIVVV